MTTYVDFVPSSSAPFQFQPTLDGQVYNAVVTWNISVLSTAAPQRYYINLYALDGTLIFALPLIGSPTGFEIESLSWANGSVTVTTTTPHGYRIGQTIALTISSCTPTAYNGVFNCLILSPSNFSYPLPSNPGVETSLGNVIYNINLASGYFQTSTLVFREASQQFEVNP